MKFYCYEVMSRTSLCVGCFVDMARCEEEMNAVYDFLKKRQDDMPMLNKSYCVVDAKNIIDARKKLDNGETEIWPHEGLPN